MDTVTVSLIMQIRQDLYSCRWGVCKKVYHSPVKYFQNILLCLINLLLKQAPAYPGTNEPLISPAPHGKTQATEQKIYKTKKRRTEVSHFFFNEFVNRFSQKIQKNAFFSVTRFVVQFITCILKILKTCLIQLFIKKTAVFDPLIH